MKNNDGDDAEAEAFFSIARLTQLIRTGGSAPSVFDLGGRYWTRLIGRREGESPQPILSDAFGFVTLPRHLDAQPGQLVVIRARREDFIPVAKSLENFNRADEDPENFSLAMETAGKIRGEAGRQNFGAVLGHFSNIIQYSVISGAGDRKEASKPLWSWRTADLWSKFLFGVREFFHQKGLIEVTTPSLVKNPGMEPELEPFATTWRRGSQATRCFLPTSPELHLKPLIAYGFTDIFEIKTVFRNEELTDLHQPEFSLLEWYRGFADLKLIEQDLAELIFYLQAHVFQNEVSSDLQSTGGRLARQTVASFFKERLGFNLRPQTSREELLDLARRLELISGGSQESLDWNDLYHLIWISKIEPHLPQSAFLLCDYPPSQAALACLTADGWADRFEFYWRGVEIANAFHELTDPAEQRRRFERDQKKRLEYGRTPLEIDEDFMRALEYGLPPSGGIALGLDRLFMVMAGLPDLKSTRAFPLE